MVRITLIAVIILRGFFSVSQENEKGNIVSAFSFSPSFLTERTYALQAHGYLGYLKNHIELRVDGFYFLGSYGGRPRFTQNHQLLLGATYHFKNDAFSPYFGFQPGIAFSQSSEYGTLNKETGEIEFKKAITPIGSGILGFSHSIKSFFFVFVEGRYIFGKHKANTYPTFLDELRMSIGLGFRF